MRDVLLPQFGMGMTSGTIIAWHARPDETIREGDILFEVEAAKTSVEVPAPCNGILREIRAEVGQEVEVRTVVAVIDDGIGETALDRARTEESSAEKHVSAPLSPASKADLQSPTRNQMRQVEPRARKLAKDNSVDLDRIAGTGPNGRVVEEDVARFIARNRTEEVKHRLEIDAEYDLTPLRTLVAELERSCPGMEVNLDDALVRIVSLAAERAELARTPIVIATEAGRYVDCHRSRISEGLKRSNETSSAVFARVWTVSSNSIRRFRPAPAEESLTISLVSGPQRWCQLCLQFNDKTIQQERALALIAEIDALMETPIALLA